MNGCISSPISWLRLERYAMGELPAERAEIAAHLEACTACKECWLRIERDTEVALPPLPVAARPRRSWGTAVVTAGGVLALAAAVLLGIGRGPVADPMASSDRVKGDAVVFVLVRDDGARIVDAESTFAAGERYKALVTCSPAARATFDVVVWDPSGASFPLPGMHAPFECGNEVALPGAFRLTGDEPLRVCLVWSAEGGLDRDELTRAGPTSARASQSCKVLTPAGSLAPPRR